MAQEAVGAGSSFSCCSELLEWTMGFPQPPRNLARLSPCPTASMQHPS